MKKLLICFASIALVACSGSNKEEKEVQDSSETTMSSTESSYSSESKPDDWWETIKDTPACDWLTLEEVAKAANVNAEMERESSTDFQCGYHFTEKPSEYQRNSLAIVKFTEMSAENTKGYIQKARENTTMYKKVETDIPDVEMYRFLRNLFIYSTNPANTGAIEIQPLYGITDKEIDAEIRWDKAAQIAEAIIKKYKS